MNLSRLTIEYLVAFTVLALNVVFAVLFSTVSPDGRVLAVIALLLSLPGLVLIGFHEALSTVNFKRGVGRESPPRLVDMFGWLFLVGLPVLFLYGLQP